MVGEREIRAEIGSRIDMIQGGYSSRQEMAMIMWKRKLTKDIRNKTEKEKRMGRKKWGSVCILQVLGQRPPLGK